MINRLLEGGNVFKDAQGQPLTQRISQGDVPATINRGVPIVLDDPKHPVTDAVRKVALQAFGEFRSDYSIPDTETSGDRKSFMRRKAKS